MEFNEDTFSFRGFPRGAMVKNLPASAGDSRNVDLTPGSGRSSRVINDNSLCLENSTNRGACRVTVHGVAKSLHT